jgi:hypothetical protein
MLFDISVLGSGAGVIVLLSIAYRMRTRLTPADYLERAAKCEAQARECDWSGDHEGAERARQLAELNRQKARMVPGAHRDLT